MRRYIQKYRKWAVDERCQCSHGRSNHQAQDIQLRDRTERQDGLGRCSVAGCACGKFRRTGWVFEGEQQGEP